MASVRGKSSNSAEEADLDTVHELIFSLGQLKFSLRSLSSMHVQTALFSQKETAPPKRLTPLESNAQLENAIDEVLSTKQVQIDQITSECESDKVDPSLTAVEPSLTVEDLEMIHKKLQGELDKRKDLFLKSISEKIKT